MTETYKLQYLIVWADGCACDWETIAESKSMDFALTIFGGVLINGHIYVGDNYTSIDIGDNPEEGETMCVIRLISPDNTLINSSSTRNCSVNFEHSLYKGLKDG